MIKLGIVSDLHLEFRDFTETLTLRNLIVNNDCDAVINAGDFHPQTDIRNLWESSINPHKVYLPVYGNHDYYGHQLGDCHWTTCLPGGIRVVGCSLWTNFDNGNPLVLGDYKFALADGVKIQKSGQLSGKTLEGQIYLMHQRHLEYIKKHKPTIVVTHHSPSFQSVAYEFRNAWPMNYFFHSDLDNFILDNDNIKLWAHGHTHYPFDYMIDSCRIVCNPLGYPHEQSVADYKLFTLEM